MNRLKMDIQQAISTQTPANRASSGHGGILCLGTRGPVQGPNDRSEYGSSALLLQEARRCCHRRSISRLSQHSLQVQPLMGLLNFEQACKRGYRACLATDLLAQRPCAPHAGWHPRRAKSKPYVIKRTMKPFSHSAFSIGSKESPRLRTPALWLVSVLFGFCAASALPAQGAAPSPAAPAVKGTPRLASGHPRTLWDNQDVAAYRASLKTSPALKGALEELQAWGNGRVAEPLNVPAHKLEADGNWTFPAFKRGYQDASGKWNWEWDFNARLQRRTEDVSSLGMLYALTGDEKYAAFGGQILLGLADAYGPGKGSTVPDPHGYDHFEAYGFDGGDIGMFLAKACHGYDLIYNLPTLSAEDRTHIERDLIRPLAEHLKKFTFMYTSHGRWGMVCLYGLFIAGETLHDQALVDLALYGPGGTRDKVSGGFMDCFKPTCLRDGVVWGADTKIEEQMAAVCVLTTVAEVMWHHGVDLYGYQDMAIKKSYDAALESTGNGEVSKLLALPGIDAYPYILRRYQEPRYLAVVSKLKPGFTLAISEHLPSLPPAAASVK